MLISFESCSCCNFRLTCTKRCQDSYCVGFIYFSLNWLHSIHMISNQPSLQIDILALRPLWPIQGQCPLPLSFHIILFLWLATVFTQGSLYPLEISLIWTFWLSFWIQWGLQDTITYVISKYAITCIIC